MQIRATRNDDLDRVMQIYEYARDFMIKNGNPHQWAEKNWPPRELIEDDIKNSRSFVCEHDGKVVGVFAYLYGKDIEPTYLNIEDGKWLDDSAYGVVHRIAADGSVKGTGSFCLEWAYEKSCEHLRIDTHSDNKVVQNLLLKNGFIHCGTIYVEEDNYPRLAYEKTKAKDKK